MEWIVKFLFGFSFLLIFILGTFKLHPFRKHQIWNISTFYLKFSYLAYLFFLLIFTYISIFHRDAFNYNPNWVNDVKMSLFHTFILFLYLFPTGIIIIRKKIKYRKHFNMIFGSVNILLTLTTLFLIVRFYFLNILN